MTCLLLTLKLAHPKEQKYSFTEQVIWLREKESNSPCNRICQQVKAEAC